MEELTMTTELIHLDVLARVLIQLRQDHGGECTAEVAGMPELQATAPNRAEAIERVRALLVERFSSGDLIALPVLRRTPRKPPGWANDDPLEQEFLAELARRRAEDLEQTIREYEEEDRRCSDTSSTPTT
jgi:hypothetical protein